MVASPHRHSAPMDERCPDCPPDGRDWPLALLALALVTAAAWTFADGLGWI